MRSQGSARAMTLGVALLLVGCAHYSSSGGLVGGIRTVAIPTAENLVDNLRLDHDYTVFGEVVSGMDVVDQVAEGDVIVRATVVRRQEGP